MESLLSLLVCLVHLGRPFLAEGSLSASAVGLVDGAVGCQLGLGVVLTEDGRLASRPFLAQWSLPALGVALVLGTVGWKRGLRFLRRRSTFDRLGHLPSHGILVHTTSGLGVRETVLVARLPQVVQRSARSLLLRLGGECGRRGDNRGENECGLHGLSTSVVILNVWEGLVRLGCGRRRNGNRSLVKRIASKLGFCLVRRGSKKIER